MAGTQTKIQGFVHSLDQGRLARVIQVIAAITSILALAAAYLLIQFRGLSSEAGMDQAQVARQLARGEGFSTKNLRILALEQLQKRTGRISVGRFPDTFNAPLNPVLNALTFRVFSGALSKRIGTTDSVYLGDKLVAALSILFFLGAVVVNFFLAKRLFGTLIAAVGTALILIADQFWQFSLSGLPQMLLLFLFSCVLWTLAGVIRAGRTGRPVLLRLALVGLFLGLMALTHPLTLWICAGVGIFLAIHFHGNFVRIILPLVICGAMFSLWIIRDYRVSGTPFGISPYAFLDGVTFSEAGWMRGLQPETQRFNFLGFRKRTLDEFNYQLGSLYVLLGGVGAAPIFFLSLLHRFKRDGSEALKWAVLLMWVSGFIGSVLIGVNRQSLSPNEIHILFGPLMTCYGLEFALVCLKRGQFVGVIFRYILFALFFILTGIPTLLGFFAENLRMQFPPYVPYVIEYFADWTKPNEMIVSDMPWAVAWYADRGSLCLPASLNALAEYYNLETFGAPIAGVYVTPVSRDLSFLSNLGVGEYKELLPLLLPSPKSLENFPLRFVIGIADNKCLFFSDRQRWEENH